MDQVTGQVIRADKLQECQKCNLIRAVTYKAAWGRWLCVDCGIAVDEGFEKHGQAVAVGSSYPPIKSLSDLEGLAARESSTLATLEAEALSGYKATETADALEYFAYQVKDSGKRQEFETGARRDVRDGKGRYDLISPVFLRELAVHLEQGAIKYGDRNWERGIPIGRFLDSALRHLNSWREGDRVENHLAAAAWNIQGMIHTRQMIALGLLPKSLDDNGYLEGTDERS